MNSTDTDKDLPLREDTRLLAACWGSTAGAGTGIGYERIEAIRQTAPFRRARSWRTRPASSGRSTRCGDLPIAQTARFVAR